MSALLRAQERTRLDAGLFLSGRFVARALRGEIAGAQGALCTTFNGGKKPARGGPKGDKQQQDSGWREPARHFPVKCLLGFEDHVDLAAGLEHLPGAGKAGRNHEAVARAHGLGVAIGIT